MSESDGPCDRISANCKTLLTAKSFRLSRRGFHVLFGTFEHGLSVKNRERLKVAIDIVLIALAAAGSWTVVIGREVSLINAGWFVAIALVIRIPVYLLLGIWKHSWRQIAPQDMMQLALSAFAAVPALAIVLYLSSRYHVSSLLPSLSRPFVVIVTESAFYLLFLCSVRLIARISNYAQADDRRRVPVLVVGVTPTAAVLGQLLEEAGDEYTVVGFLDEDRSRLGRRIRGKPVLGAFSDAGQIAQQSKAEVIVIAEHSLGPDRLRQMLLSLECTGLPIRIVPSVSDIVTRRARLDDLRSLRMEDLLPRNVVHLDRTGVSGYLENRTVLVTGGGGSIGRQLCRQIIEAGARQVLVLGRGENSVFEAVQELEGMEANCAIIPVICCIRDRVCLERVLRRFCPSVVFHAAAHKHVPLMEQYPTEAINNNVLGTLNLVELCVQYGIERFVLVSTDKAVNPASIMGASKRVAEQIVRAYAEENKKNMVSVRFGNVLGSRGSVVPIMTRQIHNRRPVTITHPDMVRYFMTIPEAVELILYAGAMGGYGETYVLKMGRPVRITDLACDLIRLAGLTPHVDIPLCIVGCRPGEKLQEELFTCVENEGVRVSEHLYVAPGRRLSLKYVMDKVDRLRQAADDDDLERIRQTLLELIPDYSPAVQSPESTAQTALL